MAFQHQLIALGLLLALGACQHQAKSAEFPTAKAVETADGKVVAPPLSPEEVAEDAEVLGFSRVQVALPRGAKIGHTSYQFLVCNYPFGTDVYYSADRATIIARDFPDNFYRVLSGHGYRMAGDPNKLFNEGSDERPVYQIAASITAINLEANYRCDFIGNPRSMMSKASVTVEWQVFAPLTRRIVWRGATTGVVDSPEPHAMDIMLPLGNAFAEAANNLAVLPAFREAVSKRPTRPPARDTKVAGDPKNDAARQELATIVFPKLPVFTQRNPQNIENARRATVLITDGNGHGSGVIISENGLVLTNHHVVTNNRFMNIRLVSGRTVVGEVLRFDQNRDIALMKIEGFGYPTVPIRTDPVIVSEEVYAIGAPKQESLGWTVSKGIVSAYRQGVRLEGGAPIDLIQSDVEIHGGNSGGPLLDANGNLIGLSVITFVPTPGQIGMGLNGFVPIVDGLEKIRLEAMTETEMRRRHRDGSLTTN